MKRTESAKLLFQEFLVMNQVKQFLLRVSLRDKIIVLYWYMIQLTIVLMNKNYYKVDSKFTKTYVIRKATNKQTQPVISKTYNKSKYIQHSDFFDNIISEFI